MTDPTTVPLTVTVGDQVLRIRVAEADRARCERAAQTAHRTLEQVLGGGVVGGLRAYAMACLQLAMELEEARDAQARLEESRNRLGQLLRRLDHADADAAPPGPQEST